MHLRTHITRPRRFEHSPDPPGSSCATATQPTMAPKEKLLPKKVRPAFKPPFVEYDPSLPPACFPTMADPVPNGELSRRQKGREAEGGSFGSEDGDGDSGESGDDGGDEEEGGDDVGMPGVDEGDDLGEQDPGTSSEVVEVARDPGEVIAIDDEDGGTGEDCEAENTHAEGRSMVLMRESSHVVEETVKNLQSAAMALKDVARNMSPERGADAVVVDVDQSSSVANTLQEQRGEDLDGGRNISMGVDVGEASGGVDFLTQGIQDAAQTMVETSNIISGVVNRETWTTLTPADTGLPGEWEDVDQNAMFRDAHEAPTTAIEASGPIGWRDLNISLRLEVLANALAELYDMKSFCDDLEIDEEAFIHSCVCLNQRTKHLRYEDILIDKAIKQANDALSTPGLMEYQYYHRHGKYPTVQQKLAFEQEQFHGHTLATIDRCILRDSDTLQFQNFNQMFHCTKSDLRKAQKFLQTHNYEPRLAGGGWTGGERAALEAVLKLDGLSVSKTGIQNLKRVAEEIGVDLDLDDAPEMIDLLDGPFISTGQYSSPLHLGNSEAQRANPLVRSGSSSSTDSEEERRMKKRKILRFKLPNSRLALLALRDGARAVQNPYNLPERYVNGMEDGPQKLSPPSNLDRRPRRFSPPRWHRRPSLAQDWERGRSRARRESFLEGDPEPRPSNHSTNEQIAAVSGVQGAGRGIKLNLRVPEGLLTDLGGDAPTTESLPALTKTHGVSTHVTAVAPAALPLNAAEGISVVSTPTTLVEQTEISTFSVPVDLKEGVRHGEPKQKNLGFQVDTEASQAPLSRLGENPIPTTPEPLTARIPEVPIIDTTATPTGTNQDPPLSPDTAQRAISSLLDKILTPGSRTIDDSHQLLHNPLESFVNRLRRGSLDSQPKSPSTPTFESITPEKASPPSPTYKPALLPERALINTTTGGNQSQAQITGEGSLITPVSASTENPTQALPVEGQDVSKATGVGFALPGPKDQISTLMRTTTPMSDTTTSADFHTPRTGTTPYATEKHDTTDASEISQQTQGDRNTVSTIREDEETVLAGIEDSHLPARGKLPIQRQIERVRSESTRRGKLRLPVPRSPSVISSRLATPATSKSELDVGGRAISISSFAPTDEDSSSANYMTEDDKAKSTSKKRKVTGAKKAIKAMPIPFVEPVVSTPPQTSGSSSKLQQGNKPSKSSPKTPIKKATTLKPPPGESTATKKGNIPITARRRSTRTNTSTTTSKMPTSNAETMPIPLSIVDRLSGTRRKNRSTTHAPQITTSLGTNITNSLPEPSQSAPGHKRRISLIVKEQPDPSDPSFPSKKPRLKSPARTSPDSTSKDVTSSSTIQDQPARSSLPALCETMDGNTDPSDAPLNLETQPPPSHPSSKPPPKSTNSVKNTTPKPLPHTPLTRSVARTPIHNLRSSSIGRTSAPPAQRAKRARNSNIASTKKEKAAPKPSEPKNSSDQNKSATPKKFGWGGHRVKGSGKGNHNKRKDP